MAAYAPRHRLARLLLLLAAALPIAALAASDRPLDESATVWADIAVGADGKVTEVSLLGRVSTSALAPRLIQSVRAWEFKPARRNGVAVPATSGLAIDLRLQETPAGVAISVRDVYASPRTERAYAPTYPARALGDRIEGTVHVQFTVSETGRTIELGSPERDSQPLLAKAAIDAVRHWRFKPQTVDGIAVASRASVPIVFRLDRPGARTPKSEVAPDPSRQDSRVTVETSVLELATPLADLRI